MKTLNSIQVLIFSKLLTLGLGWQTQIKLIEITDNVYVVRADIKKARAIRWIDHVECKNEFTGNKTVPIPEIKNSAK